MSNYSQPSIVPASCRHNFSSHERAIPQPQSWHEALAKAGTTALGMLMALSCLQQTAAADMNSPQGDVGDNIDLMSPPEE